MCVSIRGDVVISRYKLNHQRMSVQELAEEIAQAPTVDEVLRLSLTQGHERQEANWEEVKGEVLLTLLRAKFRQSAEAAAALKATAPKTIVCVDTDGWAGMAAAGGIATGQNHVGKALETVRAELLA